MICVLGGGDTTMNSDFFNEDVLICLYLANFVSTNLDSADRVGFYMHCSMPYSVSTKPVIPVLLAG